MDSIPRLREIAEQGTDINAFYAEVIHRHQRILDEIDAEPFVETPLHVAAALGHISFSMEMMRLKPSFARKPNLDGYTPIHLALQREDPKCNLLVQAIARIEPDLVRAKGRGGVTPLHLVAELGNGDLLLTFLVACPDSIKDVTVGNESALHTALKHDTDRSFDVLLGWLKRGLYDDKDAMKKTLLTLQDNDGNTVLHIATSKNRSHVVMELLKNKVNANLKNVEGHTPLDINIIDGQRSASPANKMIKGMLLGAGALIADRVIARPTDVEKLTAEVSFVESKSISFFRRIFFMPVNKSNLLLVVAILIVTTTYQTGLSPPGGVWQDDTNSSCSNNTITAKKLTHDFLRSEGPHNVGYTVLSPTCFFYFLFLNTTAFCLSTAIIFLLLPNCLSGVLLRFALVVLYLCYITSVHFISVGVVSVGIYFGLSILGLCLALGFYFFRNLCTLVIPIGLKEL